jgi:hypothetical protein
MLHNIRFKLKGVAIEGEGKVIHVKEGKNDKGQPMLKVGVEFIGLAPQHEKAIVQFALDESRRLFSLLY